MGEYLHATVFSFFILIFLGSIRFSHSTQNGYTKTKFGSRSKLDFCYKNLTQPNNSQATSIQRYSAKFCLGARLSYRTTIVPDYVPDIQSIDHISYYLEKWEQFQYLPKCWQNLQVILCSIYMPQLDEDPTMIRAARVSRPSVDSCNNLVNNPHCKFIARHYGWPSIFNCSDSNIYAKNCSTDIRDFRFHRSVVCSDPLVPSNDSSSWFKDISGCAMHCKYPILDNKDQKNIKYLIEILSITGFLVTSIAIWVMDKSSKMLKVIGKCILCQPLLYLGWSLQTILGDIACGSSGASLYDLPLNVNSCLLSFIMTYPSMIHFLISYAQMGETCYRELTKGEVPNKEGAETAQSFVDETKAVQTQNQTKVTNNRDQDNDIGKETIVNWLSYCLPVILFIAVASLGQIDGHGIYGICTVGQKSIIMKSLFVFAPDFFCTFYGNTYNVRTIYSLSKQKNIEPNVKKNYYRVFAIVILSFSRLLLSIGNHVYAYYNRNVWENSVDKFVSCKLNPHLDDHDYEAEVMSKQECELNIDPLVSLYYLELISTLGLAVIIASWAYRDKNIRDLNRKIINLLESDEDRVKRDYWNLMVCSNYTPVAMDTLNLPPDQASSRPPSSLRSTSLRSELVKKCNWFIQRKRGSRRRESMQQELKRRDSFLSNSIRPDYFEFSRAMRDREPPPSKPPEFYFSIDGTQDKF